MLRILSWLPVISPASFAIVTGDVLILGSGELYSIPTLEFMGVMGLPVTPDFKLLIKV
jgi:hypothetical protein